MTVTVCPVFMVVIPFFCCLRKSHKTMAMVDCPALTWVLVFMVVTPVNRSSELCLSPGGA